MLELKPFIQRLQNHPRVIIQAHDFPDHDAVSAAFALSELLTHFDIPTLIIYNGHIDRKSIHTMIETCGIRIQHWQDTDIRNEDIAITVDGCIGEKNILDTPCREIAVIDHHEVNPPDNLWYCDIRPNYGATATILTEYYQQLGVPMSRDVASALLIGLNIDTAHLTRGYADADVIALNSLHRLAHTPTVNRICNNTLELQDLAGFKDLLQEPIISERIAFAYLENCHSKNILGILSDFLMSIDEIDITIIAAHLNDRIHISLRSERDSCDVAALAKRVLEQEKIGFGGGHKHMAGGTIFNKGILQSENPKKTVSTLFFSALKSL